MLISNLFVRHKVPPPRFAPGMFLFLLAAFALLGHFKPIFGLVGIGTTLVVVATLVEFNRSRIWETYQKTYKRQKGTAGLWTKPNPVYYNINVFMLWPFILFLGLVCLWAAYMVS
jgi:hypothetical protein